MFALIVNKQNLVIEIAKNKREVCAGVTWVDLGDNSDKVESGWTYKDEKFTAPVPVIPYDNKVHVMLTSVVQYCLGNLSKDDLQKASVKTDITNVSTEGKI